MPKSQPSLNFSLTRLIGVSLPFPQPSFPICGNPSRSFWSFFRRYYLLHPSGIPLFNSKDLTMRHTEPLSDADMAAVPSDWLVVYLQRAGRREVKQQKEVLRMLQQMFGKKRVQSVEGGHTFARCECGEISIFLLVRMCGMIKKCDAIFY